MLTCEVTLKNGNRECCREWLWKCLSGIDKCTPRLGWWAMSSGRRCCWTGSRLRAEPDVSPKPSHFNTRADFIVCAAIWTLVFSNKLRNMKCTITAKRQKITICKDVQIRNEIDHYQRYHHSLQNLFSAFSPQSIQICRLDINNAKQPIYCKSVFISYSKN